MISEQKSNVLKLNTVFIWISFRVKKCPYRYSKRFTQQNNPSVKLRILLCDKSLKRKENLQLESNNTYATLICLGSFSTSVININDVRNMFQDACQSLPDVNISVYVVPKTGHTQSISYIVFYLSSHCHEKKNT